MSKKSNALSKLLTNAFKGRDLTADAKSLGMSEELLTAYINGEGISGITPVVAVKIGELVSIHPGDILNAANEVSLEELGVKPKPAVEKRTVVVGEGKSSTKTPHKSPAAAPSGKKAPVLRW